MELILEIPSIPESFKLIETREAWMDYCQDLIERKKLNELTLEVLKHYLTLDEILNIAEAEGRKTVTYINGSPAYLPSSLLKVHHTLAMRMLECSEILGFTPKDRDLFK